MVKIVEKLKEKNQNKSEIMYRLYREKEKHEKGTDNKIRGNMRSKKKTR